VVARAADTDSEIYQSRKKGETVNVYMSVFKHVGYHSQLCIASSCCSLLPSPVNHLDSL